MMNCSYDAFNKSESYSPRKPNLPDTSSFTQAALQQPPSIHPPSIPSSDSDFQRLSNFITLHPCFYCLHQILHVFEEASAAFSRYLLKKQEPNFAVKAARLRMCSRAASPSKNVASTVKNVPVASHALFTGARNTLSFLFGGSVWGHVEVKSKGRMLF